MDLPSESVRLPEELRYMAEVAAKYLGMPVAGLLTKSREECMALIERTWPARTHDATAWRSETPLV